MPASDPLPSKYKTLIASLQSLLLATNNASGEAEISYAPFLQIDNTFFVFVSSMANHTGNMLRNKQASVMFIQPEALAANPFARQRLTLHCSVSEIGREDQQYLAVLDAMQNRFGEILTVLRALPDFHLLALQPQAPGLFVAGFGKAHKVELAVHTEAKATDYSST